MRAYTKRRTRTHLYMEDVSYFSENITHAIFIHALEHPVRNNTQDGSSGVWCSDHNKRGPARAKSPLQRQKSSRLKKTLNRLGEEHAPALSDWALLAGGVFALSSACSLALTSTPTERSWRSSVYGIGLRISPHPSLTLKSKSKSKLI